MYTFATLFRQPPGLLSTLDHHTCIMKLKVPERQLVHVMTYKLDKNCLTLVDYQHALHLKNCFSEF